MRESDEMKTRLFFYFLNLIFIVLYVTLSSAVGMVWLVVA